MAVSRLLCAMRIFDKKISIALLAALCVAAALGPARAADKFASVDVRKVKVGGVIGHRIDITVDNNLLVLDYEKDFLKPFQQRKRTAGYVGLGKTIDALVRMAAHTGDEAMP